MKSIFALLLISLSFQASAEGPKQINVSCQVGNTSMTVALKSCSDEIDASGYGPYWCSGKIDNKFSAKFIGMSGTNYGEIRITFEPKQFSGVTPIEVGDLRVDCQLAN